MEQNKNTHSRGIRWLLALLVLAITVGALWRLYDEEFHYADSPEGYQQALESYIPNEEGSSIQNVTPGTPLRLIAHQKVEDQLFLFYGAENQDNVHGILYLQRGINGKYRPIEADISPFPYSAGVYGGRFETRKDDWSPIVLGGDGCESMASVEVTYSTLQQGQQQPQKKSVVYPIIQPDFLWVKEWEDIAQELGLAQAPMVDVGVEDIRLLDGQGQDVTENYRLSQVEQNWTSGKSTAELGMLYIWMGLAALVGLVIAAALVGKKQN